MSGNEEIVGSDHLASFLQLRAYLGVVGRSLIWKLEHFDVGKECLQCGRIVYATERDFNARDSSDLVITNMQTSATVTWSGATPPGSNAS